MRVFRFLIVFTILVSALTLAEVDRVIVTVIGDDESLVRSIEQRLSRIVAGFLSEKDKKIIVKHIKECEAGLLECVDFGKFPWPDSW